MIHFARGTHFDSPASRADAAPGSGATVDLGATHLHGQHSAPTVHNSGRSPIPTWQPNWFAILLASALCWLTIGTVIWLLNR